MVLAVLLVIALSILQKYVPAEHAANGFLMCFSYNNKFKELYENRVSTNAISAIDGIRSTLEEILL